MKDQELENILNELRKEAVSEQRVQKWKTALKTEKQAIERTRRVRLLPLLLASFTGFVFGAALFGGTLFVKNEATPEKNLAENATIEHIYNKID